MFIALPGSSVEDLDPLDVDAVQRMAKFQESSSGYAKMHATRPSTIGHALASSPLALLAW